MLDVHFSTGETIYREGDVSDAVFVIESGSVEVSRNFDGRGVRLGLLGSGEIFGESGVIQDKPRSTTMMALSEVKALKLSAQQFLGAFGEDNPVGLPLLRMLCERLAKADEKLLDKKIGKAANARATEIGSIRLLGASPVVGSQIGADGIPVKEFPFRVGRRVTPNQATVATAHGLSLHVFSDYSISAEHFAIEKRQGNIIVRDLGSYLGTIVNGARLSRYGGSATAPLNFGANTVIAGTTESPYRFTIVIERAAIAG
ncbi:MAG: cyclic nucleotide-binding domain-containing protein [Sphingomonadales bacterium]